MSIFQEHILKTLYVFFEFKHGDIQFISRDLTEDRIFFLVIGKLFSECSIYGSPG